MTKFAITPPKIVVDIYFLYQNGRWNVLQNIVRYNTQFWFSLRKVPFVKSRHKCQKYSSTYIVNTSSHLAQYIVTINKVVVDKNVIKNRGYNGY